MRNLLFLTTLFIALSAVLGVNINLDAKVDPHKKIYFNGTGDHDTCWVIPLPPLPDGVDHWEITEFRADAGRGNVPFFITWAIEQDNTFFDQFTDGYVDQCWHIGGGELDYVYGWRRGHGLRSIKFDGDQGMPLYNVKALLLETPFKNRGVQGVTDTVGVTITLTSVARPKKVGILITGIEDGVLTQLRPIPPRMPRVTLSVHNPRNATYFDLFWKNYDAFYFFYPGIYNMERLFQAVGSDSIDVLFGLLHTNQRGVEASAVIWRDGAGPADIDASDIVGDINALDGDGNLITYTNIEGEPIGIPELLHSVDLLDARQGGWVELRKTINLGDSISLYCTYDTLEEENPTPGDFRSNGEMCNGIFYITATPQGDEPTPEPQSFSDILVNFFGYNMISGDNEYNNINIAGVQPDE